MLEHTPQTDIYRKAKALAAFARYSEVGALSVLRGAPHILEAAIGRVSDEGVKAAEDYLGAKDSKGRRA